MRATYELVMATEEQSFDTLFGFQLQHCVPFASFMGSTYVVYAGEELVEGFSHPVIHMFEDVAVSFLNLPTMILTLTAWYQQGNYRLETINELLKRDIWRTLKPGVLGFD